jgi:Flp pilus assembly pilin Flp
MNLFSQRGQSKLEYALIISLVAIAALIALAFLTPQINALFKTAANLNPAATAEEDALTTEQILADFQARIQAYYAQYGRYPRTWIPYNFTDIGLDPADQWFVFQPTRQ